MTALEYADGARWTLPAETGHLAIADRVIGYRDRAIELSRSGHRRSRHCIIEPWVIELSTIELSTIELSTIELSTIELSGHR